MKVKELLALEPGKIYTVKILEGSMSASAWHGLNKMCLGFNIRLIPIWCHNVNDIKFEEKYVKP